MFVEGFIDTSVIVFHGRQSHQQSVDQQDSSIRFRDLVDDSVQHGLRVVVFHLVIVVLIIQVILPIVPIVVIVGLLIVIGVVEDVIHYTVDKILKFSDEFGVCCFFGSV